MTVSAEIIGIGAINVDQIVLLPSFPKENRKIHADGFFLFLGGTVPTALIMAHVLGSTVKFYGTVGDDLPGDFIRTSLQKYGIDTSTISIQTGKISAFSQVWINASNGSRTIARSQGTMDPIKPNFSESTFNGVKILHLDAREIHASLTAATVARKKRITVTFDVGSPKPRSEEIVQVSDIVFVPKQYLIDRYGTEDLLQGAKEVHKNGPHTVIATDGENGLAVLSPEGSFVKKSFQVETVDSNGAGDIFAGAFLHAYLEKKKLMDCVAFAQAAAAIKCTRLGKEKLPTEKEITEFLKSRIVGT